jgi:ATP-dependent helicase HrpB
MHIPRILAALERASVVTVVAPPGSGKTTRVPAAVLDAGLAGDGKVCVLQPRRIAAAAVASRIAEERGGVLGQEVGYRVRFDSKVSALTRLEVVTEGILTRTLQRDPLLDGVGCVVLDEFHERSLHADLALAFLCDVRRQVRPDLRLVVMSATLDGDRVASFAGGEVVVVEGATHPVEVVYAGPFPSGRNVVDRVCEAVRSHAKPSQRESGQSTLVFLPGAGEIERCRQNLEHWAHAAGLDVVVLHGRLSLEAQRLALAPGARPRVILATNIAETSLTVPDVATVIDSGLVRELRFDVGRGFDSLELVRTSQASAAQRAGRAGRVGPGRAIRLWTSAEHYGLALHTQPDVSRLDAARAVLEVSGWSGAPAGQFEWFEAPPPRALLGATAALQAIGALDDKAHVTPRGRRVLELPLQPRLASLMLHAADRGQSRLGAALAAALSELDFPVATSHVLDLPGADLESDVSPCVAEVLAAMPSAGSEHRGGAPLRAAARVANELSRLVPSVGSAARASQGEDLGRLILAAFPDRLCLRRAPNAPDALLSSGSAVRVGAHSKVQSASLFVAVSLGAGAKGTSGLAAVPVVTAAQAVSREWLALEAPHWMSQAVELIWDSSSRGVFEVESTRFGALVLEQVRRPARPSAEASAVLAERALERLAELIASNPGVERLVQRLAVAARWMPERGLPDGMALARADIRGLCEGRTRWSELNPAALEAWFWSIVGRELRRDLDEWLPESIALPSGRTVSLDVTQVDNPPVVAAPLQEFFGWTDAPTLCGGKLRVSLHLLAPNGRPAQVTSDLRSFWTTGYPEVRKELRARYPKHHWPEDPWTAQYRRPGRHRT